LTQVLKAIRFAYIAFVGSKIVASIAESRGIDNSQAGNEPFGFSGEAPAIGAAGHTNIREKQIEVRSLAQDFQRFVAVAGSDDIKAGLAEIFKRDFAYEQLVFNQKDFAHLKRSRHFGGSPCPLERRPID